MKRTLLTTTIGVGLACLFTASSSAQSGDEPIVLIQESIQPITFNALTPAQRAAGWELLFDGSSTNQWRGYRQDGFPEKGWTVEDGCIKVVSKGGGGDIITVDQYGDFELYLEWKVSPRANSGIMYRVTEEHNASWQTGPEYQILDDAGHGLPPTEPHSAGALYDLASPSKEKVSKPTGEFNTTRILVHNGRIKHWLNGVKIVDIPMAGDDWAERIAGSKFKQYAGFGIQPKGHIALQDHGDAVWYRNMRVRDFSKKMPGEISLYNGKDLSGWTAFLLNDGKMNDVWRVDDEGVLICAGRPIGYIRTIEDYTNFVIKLEWRFNPVTKQAGNSGVLFRMIEEDMVWPKSIEAQLHSGNAGDFWCIGEYPMKTVPERTNGRNTKKTHFAENPIGEWNEYEIIVDRGDVTVIVNGEVLNRAWDVLETAGKICLQSEGAEIHFREIRVGLIVY